MLDSHMLVDQNNYGLWIKQRSEGSFSQDTSRCIPLFRDTSKGGGTGGARGAIAPPLFTDHLKIINYSQ